MEIFLIVFGLAVAVVGGGYAMVQMFRIVETDAVCRGLKHPKLWGWLSISGNNSAGLILYFINRRKHPVVSMTEEQRLAIGRGKRRFAVGMIFLAVGAVVLIWGAVLM